MRIIDRNRDGYADVTWDGFGGREEGAVLLNRGGGDGTRYSAWCTTRALPMESGEPAIPICPEDSGAERFLLPPGELFIDPVYDNFSEGTELADVNGDGWQDLIRNDYYHPFPREKTFLFTPGWDPGLDDATGNWVEKSEFDAPAFIGVYPTDLGAYIAADVRILDLNGDGAADFIRGDGRFSGNSPPRESWVGQGALADLLREVRTGQGGVVEIEYAGAAQQYDPGLETLAQAHALEHFEAPSGDDPVHHTSSPVVSRVRVTPLNTNGVAAETSYQYAHPRYCLEHREQHGFRLIRRTQPDGSISDTYFYQHHGRTGRLSRRVISDVSGPLQSVDEVWELPDPSMVSGAWAGDGVSETSHVGRLSSRRTALEYGTEVGDATGAVQVEKYTYNDTHGYNFAFLVETDRGSVHTFEVRVPRTADTSRWILNRIERQDLYPSGSGSFVRRMDRTYTNEGTLETESIWRDRGDGLQSPAPAPAVTSYAYDEYGNLIQRTDPLLNQTDFCYDGVPSNSSWCPSPAGQTSGSVLVGKRDPQVGSDPRVVTQIIPDPVFGVPTVVDSGYTDVPTTGVALDAFGREIASFVTPTDDNQVFQLTRTEYRESAVPPYSVTYAYTEAGQPDAEAIRTVQVGDGFGGIWKDVRQADVPSADKHVGTAVYRDPGSNLTAQTYDYACTDAGDLCSNVTGASEPAAVVTVRDALGRPIEVQTPDGTSLFHYRSAVEPVVGPDGTVGSQAVDVVLEQNAKGDLTRRSLDGDRLVAVEECTNSDPGRDAAELALETCAASGPNRTLYGYHPTGQLESIRDPLGNVLRYHFDTAGQVIRIEDPDAGISYTLYDAAGNVALTGNLDDLGTTVPSRERTYAYDELHRPTAITTPSGEPDYTMTYRPAQLQLHQESSTAGFWSKPRYDGFGRVYRERHDHSSGPTVITWTEYDLQGRPVSIGRNDGYSPALYEYQGAYLKSICVGSLDCASSENVLVDDVRYDSLGRRFQMDFAGGTRTYGYDGERRHLATDSFATAESSWGMDYGERDPLANIVSWQSSASGSLISPLVALGTYAYDHRNRLASRSVSGQSEYFGYDVLGNLTGHGTAVSGAQNQSFDSARPHAIASRTSTLGTVDYSHDEWGNLLRRQESWSGAQQHYTFDSADRLTCIGTSPGGCQTLKVVYDSQGRRVCEETSSGSGTSRYFQGDGYSITRLASGDTEYRTDVFAFGERVAYYTNVFEASAGLPTGGVGGAPPLGLVVFVPATALLLAIIALGPPRREGLLIAERPGMASLALLLVTCLAIPFPLGAGGGGFIASYRWVLSDPIGSGILVLDENGDLVRHTRFKPFGGLDAEYPGSSGDRRYYAGHPQQEETGLTYMKARWMSPETGTFLSVDPIHKYPWARPLRDPQQINAYSYARNNPIKHTDPTGLSIGPPPGIEVIRVRGCGCYGNSGSGSGSSGSGLGGANVQVVAGGPLAIPAAVAADAALKALGVTGGILGAGALGEHMINQMESSEGEGEGDGEGGEQGGDESSYTDKVGKIAEQTGQSPKDVKQAIEKVKQGGLSRDTEVRNPDVKVNPGTGDVRPINPDGSLGDSIGNIFD